jgi:hypothetical protein
VHAHAGLATHADRLLPVARGLSTSTIYPPHSPPATRSDLSPEQATAIYQTWMQRWRIVQRFPQPDWNIVDLWIARVLLAQRMSPFDVQQILQLASPGFPRSHPDPADYLRRTLARAFPAPRRGLCVAHAPTSTAAATDNDCSNFTGEQ